LYIPRYKRQESLFATWLIRYCSSITFLAHTSQMRNFNCAR
jgi:hypothetical protein